MYRLPRPTDGRRRRGPFLPNARISDVAREPRHCFLLHTGRDDPSYRVHDLVVHSDPFFDVVLTYGSEFLGAQAARWKLETFRL